jgi:Transposase DDE domain group 1
LVCGRLPADDDLASQSTLSRLENAVDAKACYRLAVALVQLYLQERERDGLPERIILDLDGTDDPAHGKQEGVAYHGFYGQHMYHPLLIFDGDTGQLITAVLRPGTCHASRGALAVLKRLVRRLRARWPGVPIEVRGDSGFAVPALYAHLEEQHIDFTIALGRNPRLEAMAAALAEQARDRRTETGEKVRLFDEGRYQADTWEESAGLLFRAIREVIEEV